jgi:hypothetical protein
MLFLEFMLKKFILQGTKLHPLTSITTEIEFTTPSLHYRNRAHSTRTPPQKESSFLPAFPTETKLIPPSLHYRNRADSTRPPPQKQS